MSGEGSGSIGGRSPVQTGYAGSAEPSETLKGVEPEGQFNTNSLTQHSPQKHMPDVRLESHELKPLHQWEVEVSAFENKYSQLVQQLQVPLKDTQNNRQALKTTINSAIEAGHQVIARYQDRLQEQLHQGLMDSDTISQLSQALQQSATGAVNKLYDLDALLSTPAKKWALRKKDLVLPKIQAPLQNFHSALQTTKDQIRAHSGEDISQSSKWEEIGAQLEVLQARLNNKVASLQELEAHLSQGKQLVEQLITESSQLMSHAKDDEQLQLQMAIQQQKLADYQLSLQCVELKSGVFSSAESQKEKVQKPLQGAIETARQLQPWVPTITTGVPQPDSAAASPLANPTLQQLASELRTAGSKEAQDVVLEKIDRFISEQQKVYESLLPLLYVATAKQDRLGGKPLPEVTDCLSAINTLAMTSTILRQAKTNTECSEVLKKSDYALTLLEDFNSNIPDSVEHLLTESLPEVPLESDHLINLLCRSIITGSPKRVSEKQHLSTLTVIQEYYSHLASQPAEWSSEHTLNTFLAHQKIEGEVFSNQEWVRKLTEQARNLDELRVLGSTFNHWEDLEKHKQLEEACKNLEQIPKDMQVPEIQRGFDALQKITEHFEDSLQQYTKQVEAQRREALKKITSQAIEEHIAHRLNNPSLFKLDHFKSSQALCNSLQAEFNKLLEGVAKIHLTPVQGRDGESILHRVDMQMHNPKETAQAFNSLMRSRHSLAKDIANKVATGKPDDLLRFDSVHKCHVWVPHPESEVHICGKALADAFDLYVEGVNAAQKHRMHIQRFSVARRKADSQIDTVIQELHHISESPAQMRGRKSTTRATLKLRGIENRLRNTKLTEMRQMASEAVKCRSEILDMLRQQQITPEQAQNLLTPLFALLHTLDSRYSAQQVARLDSTSMNPPGALVAEINKLEQPAKAAFLLKLFAKKKLEAIENIQSQVEFTKSLTAICSTCHETPMQAVKLIDDHINALRTQSGKYPALLPLIKHLESYSDNIYKQAQRLPDQENHIYLPERARGAKPD